MLPTPGDVHINGPLSNISVAYMQDASNFVASQVFPNVPVSKQSDLFYVFNHGDFNRDEMQLRAPATETVGVGYRVSNTPYHCAVWGIHKDIDDQVRANEDSQLNSDRSAVELITNKALIRKERDFVSRFFVTGVWTNQWTGVSAGPVANQFLQWDNGDSTPVEDIRDRATYVLETTGLQPNTMVIGKRVFDKLVDHPSIIDRIKYSSSNGNPALVNMQALAALFEVDRVLVMKAIYNSAIETADGTGAVHQFIGGKNVLLAYVPSSPGLMTPASGYTFSWTGYLGASAFGGRIKSFRMEEIASDRVELEIAYSMQLIGADLAAFFLDAVA